MAFSISSESKLLIFWWNLGIRPWLILIDNVIQQLAWQTGEMSWDEKEPWKSSNAGLKFGHIKLRDAAATSKVKRVQKNQAQRRKRKPIKVKSIKDQLTHKQDTIFFFARCKCWGQLEIISNPKVWWWGGTWRISVRFLWMKRSNELLYLANIP